MAIVVDSCTPNVGTFEGGTSVTIVGSGFLDGAGVDEVLFGGVAVSVTPVDDTTINCSTPAHAAGVVDVVAHNTGDDTSGTLTDGFTYYDPPVITEVVPADGPNVAIPVEIHGSGFTGATIVQFDGDDATSVSVVNDGTIACVTPSHAAGAVEVQVSNPVFNGFEDPGFTYHNPSLSSVSPSSSSPGLLVHFYGIWLTGTDGVNLVADGNAAFTSVIVVDDTEVTALFPASPITGAGSYVGVKASNPNGEGELANAIRWYSPQNATSLGPTTGPTSGSTPGIVGSGLAYTNAITSDGDSISFTIINDESVSVVMPPHVAGEVEVVITNPLYPAYPPEGSDTFTFRYYNVPAPTSVDPDFGPTAGMIPVTVHGAGFTDATSVEFDGEAATGFDPVNDTTIICTPPAHVAAVVDVEVINPDTGGLLNNGYEYTDTPPVTDDDDEELMEEYTAAVGDAQSLDLSTAITIGTDVTIPDGANALTLQAIGGVVSFRLDGGDPEENAFQLPENKFITFVDNNGRVNLNKITLFSASASAIAQFKLVMP